MLFVHSDVSDRTRLRAPVISVGNIAMGGRGKTPVTAYIARLLVEAGERPAILSRGYKRTRPEEGVVIVSDGRTILADVGRSGDEPLMLAEQVPGAAVLVGDVRALAGALAERQLGATVHILDDGFQHTSLARDIDIVIVSVSDLKGRRMPFGRLRSRVSSLRKADAVMLDAEPGTSIGVGMAGGAPQQIFQLRRMLGVPVPLEIGKTLPPGRWPVVAVAGIAEPDRFTHALRDAGWHVSRTMKFRDHHAYTKRDVDRIAEAAREAGAGAVLTTEKDAMRLRALAPFPVFVAAVPLSLNIGPPAFSEWLFQKLGDVREARL